MEALKQPTIRVVAIIAEGVPEADTKKLIAYARANNKVRDAVNSFTGYACVPGKMRTRSRKPSVLLVRATTKLIQKYMTLC